MVCEIDIKVLDCHWFLKVRCPSLCDTRLPRGNRVVPGRRVVSGPFCNSLRDKEEPATLEPSVTRLSFAYWKLAAWQRSTVKLLRVASAAANISVSKRSHPGSYSFDHCWTCACEVFSMWFKSCREMCVSPGNVIAWPFTLLGVAAEMLYCR